MFEPRAKKTTFAADNMWVEFTDDRQLGVPLSYALPKLFFDHFNDSSFVVYNNDQLIAFLIGLLSQSNNNEGYIHFAGVHPSFRKMGLASHLYSLFFEFCRLHNRDLVKCCTSPVNKMSIQFHTRLGFNIEPGDSVIDGVAVKLHYNRPDDHKVLFSRMI